MKIVLIMPPIIDPERGFVPVTCTYAGWGIIQVAGYLIKHGYDTRVVDLSGCSLAGDLCDMGIEGYDIYGISMYSEAALSTHVLCSRIREASPAAKIIIGGHHATSEWESVLAENPYVHAVVVGDGEVPMMNLVECIQTCSYDRNHDGVAYISESGKYIYQGHYVNKDLQKVELDIDWLKKEYVCFPLANYARRLFPHQPPLLKRYLERNLYHYDCQAAGILTSRGCPAKCSFCTFEISDGYYQHRLEYVLDLLEWFSGKGIYNLIFYDSSFLSDLNHVEDLCREMIRNNFSFKWTAQSQVHHKETSIIKLMAEAGLVQMNLGLESGSPTIIREMNKKFDLNSFPKVVEAYMNADVGISANIIIGSPSESDQTVRDTCRVFYQVKSEAIGVPRDLKLYPGSKWYFQAINDGMLVKDWDWKSRGVPRFIFHGSHDVQRWLIMIEAHLRCASILEKIARPISNIAMIGFPRGVDTSLLLEALGFAFPGCPVGADLMPGGDNLIIFFSTGHSPLGDLKPRRHDQFVLCNLDNDAFRLEIFNQGAM